MGNPTAIKQLKDVHMQMMDFIQANPGCTYAQVSAACGGYSIGWISQIVNSDAFKAMLAERQIEVFGELKMTMKDRVVGLAHASLKRLEEKIPVETDTDKVANVADLALKALGFGQSKTPAPGGSTTNNTLIVGSVDKDQLEAARQLMHRTQPAEVILNPLPEPASVDPK